MTLNGPSELLDAVNRRLLRELAAEPRITMSALARRVGMSAPAVSERVQRLERAGVITGYRVDISPAALGLPVTAFVRIHPTAGQLPKIAQLAKDTPEVSECHRISGEDCFLIKLHAAAIEDIEETLDRFLTYGQTVTSIVVSTPVPPRTLPIALSGTEPPLKRALTPWIVSRGAATFPLMARPRGRRPARSLPVPPERGASMQVSRRTMLAGSAAAVAAPLLGFAVPELRRPVSGASSRETARLDAADTPATVSFSIQNNTGSDTVYAFVTGQAINNGNALMLLEADGQTPYYPSSPSATGSPLPVDCAIPLNAAGGSPITITVPQLAGARLWFSIGTPITFLLNPGPALVEPSVTNSSDPNIDIQWDFAEFTYNSAQLFANISMVDFVGIPIGLALTDTSGNTQTVNGLPAGGLDTVCAGLTAQQAADGNPWTDLIVSSGGANLRALSPQNGIVYNSSLLSGYYGDYVTQVWDMYSATTLTVDTQASYGTVTGQVTNGLLTFPGVGSFAQPTAADIFSCSTGPFGTAGASGEVLAIIPRLAAAFNRSTLLIDSNQPDGENPADYYTNAITNHYARIVHATETGGLGYAFPYDDVTPDGGVNQAGPVSSGSPAQLSVTVGAVH